jgi:hypothetical protein
MGENCLQGSAFMRPQGSPGVLLVIIILNGVRLSPVGAAATTGLFYQPQMIDDGDCEATGGTNRSTRRKPTPASLCPPQILHDVTRARTWPAAVGSQRLTA